MPDENRRIEAETVVPLAFDPIEHRISQGQPRAKVGVQRCLDLGKVAVRRFKREKVSNNP